MNLLKDMKIMTSADRTNTCLTALSGFSRCGKNTTLYVTVPETMAFSVCTVCATLHDRILTVTKSKDKFMLRELKGMRQTHLGFISEERMHYRNHQDLARTYPDLYVSICIDGIDQSKCNVPHWAGNGIPKGKGV